MGETIPAHARVRIECRSHETIPIGAGVSFVGGQTLITHRLVHHGARGRSRGYLVTHGDGAWLCDPPCEVERIVGVVRAWQAGDDGIWRDVGVEIRRDGMSGVLSGALRRAICSALEVNVWIARGIFTPAYYVQRLLLLMFPRR